jgi:HrpA-like RNA helicase
MHQTAAPAAQSGRVEKKKRRANPKKRKAQLAEVSPKNASLPIHAVKHKILQVIAANSVTVLTGATGSGKVFRQKLLNLPCLDHSTSAVSARCVQAMEHLVSAYYNF